MSALHIVASLMTVVSFQSASLLNQVFPAPTGNNGYEEYLKAADILNSKSYKEFKAWNSSGDLHPQVKAPSGLSNSSTPLARKIYEVRTYGDALKLITAGNAKRTLRGQNVLMTELSRFGDLCDLVIDAAYVAYAKGDWKGGTDQLTNLLVFGSNVSKEYLIGQLKGSAILGKAFAACDFHKSQWTVADCNHIIQVVEGLLNQPATIGVAVDREETFALSAVDTFAVPKETELSDEDEAEKALNLRLKSLSDSEKNQLNVLLKERLSKSFDRYRKLFMQPEYLWKGGSELSPSEAVPPLNTINEVCSAMLGRSETFAGAIPIAVKTRIQLMLLRLHAEIQKFRWAHGRLPDQLVEVSSPEERMDPLIGEPFRFERQDSGYRLYSPGNSETGVISLTRPATVMVNAGKG
jgi:hypothetical protein